MPEDKARFATISQQLFEISILLTHIAAILSTATNDTTTKKQIFKNMEQAILSSSQLSLFKD